MKKKMAMIITKESNVSEINFIGDDLKNLVLEWALDELKRLVFLNK